MVAEVQSAATIDGVAGDRRRVTRSRSAVKQTAASAQNAEASKPEVPGRMISMTPANPTRIAVQRRQPTGSRRSAAAASVVASGMTWRMAVALAIGMEDSAVR